MSWAETPVLRDWIGAKIALNRFLSEMFDAVEQLKTQGLQDPFRGTRAEFSAQPVNSYGTKRKKKTHGASRHHK